MSNFITLEGQDGLLRAFRSEDVARVDDVVLEGESAGLAVVVSLYDGTQLTLKSTLATVLKSINRVEV